MGYGGFCTKSEKKFRFFVIFFRGGMEGRRGMEVFFYPPPLAGGGASAIAVAGGGVLPMMFGTSPPPKNSPCEFLPPPQAAEGEIPAFAGMEYGEGMERWGDGSIFLPPAACGGGASAIAVAGGGVFPMMFGTSPPPKNSPCEFLPPPRKRRRVRFRLSPEWKCGYWGGAGNACTAPLITCRGKPLPAFFATPESHALPLRCRCRRRQFSASPSGRCRCRSRSHQCSLRR